MPDPTHHDLQGGPLMAAISNELVKILRRHFGRGPTQTRTVLVEDMVVCRMADPFTTAERTLIELGGLEQVAAVRRRVRDQLDADYRDTIEGLTRRTVVGHISGVDSDPDVALEVFFLDAPV